MAKELMEIGGFITEGAEIVNHDSSLSGNGTVNSPLGLNETVLWENSAGTRTTSGTLSESMSHFEYVEFYSINNDNQCLPSTRYHVNSTFLSNISGTLGVSIGGVCFNAGHIPLIKAAQLMATDSTWTLLTTVDYVMGTTSKATDMNRCWPSKIVGINRIANN